LNHRKNIKKTLKNTIMTTLARQFSDTHTMQTENNGHTGTTLSRFPYPSEATQLTGEEFNSVWAFEFPDGSRLFETPGQVANTVSVSN